MICQNCGKENKADSLFCTACGRRLSIVSTVGERTEPVDDALPFGEEKTVIVNPAVPRGINRTRGSELADALASEEVPDFDYGVNRHSYQEPDNLQRLRPEGDSGIIGQEPYFTRENETGMQFSAPAFSGKNKVLRMGDLFLLLQSASAISMMIYLLKMSSKFADAIDSILDLTMPDLDFGMGPQLLLLTYFLSIVMGIVFIILSVAKDMKSQKKWFADPGILLSIAIIIIMICDHGVCLIAKTVLNVVNGNFSWALLQDLLAIKESYPTVKTLSILSAAAAFAAILWVLIKSILATKNSWPGQAASHDQAKVLSSPDTAYINQLSGLKKLLDDGIITEAEYEQKKNLLKL